jgi:hypothetical protein
VCDVPHGEGKVLDQDNSISIKIEYKIGEVWKHNLRLTFKGIFKVYAVLALFAGIYVIFDTWEESTPLMRVLLILLSVLVQLYKPLFTYFKAYRLVLWERNHGPLIITFGEEGIEQSLGGSQTFVPWSKIMEAEQMGDMLILTMLDDHLFLIPDSSAGFQKPVLEAMLIKKMPEKRRKRI